MAKLTDFKTPTGVSGNILNISSLWQLILGSVVLIATFAMGQNLAGMLSGRAPFIDTRPERPFYDRPDETPKTAPVEVI